MPRQEPGPAAVAMSDEQFASLPSGIDLCHQTFGDPGDPAVLLVMGLGGPMGWWDEELCRMIAARGHFVVRYDNRDTGRSTKLRQHRVGRTDLLRALVPKLGGAAPYSIGDLAEDAIGLLDHLGIDRAHVTGVSMGGMIAQTMAIAHPARVASLVSIMSTTGRRTVGWQQPSLVPNLLGRSGPTRDDYIAAAIRSGELIGSPGYPPDPGAARRRAEVTYDRGWIASGVLRHMLAVLTQPDRTADLARVTVPTTVIHGLADKLVHRSGGAATARAVPGAELIEVPQMGHDLPPALWDTYVDAIVDTAARA
ncbi:hydrolase, alpha/beta domain protein [Aeromicrobium marinum DSM 15272]|uniref:Hydrolase, alpha/beta domain protein n=1 Tax=Aeromicrobium marinum DSM 15272 TaxID=585531 RepID=E2SBG1_9ACTN|nr:alpha/beta fold hydrolase [Aeromicrobium marinum]EFQ83707.1 hydrolase, alpha/beta domain protein [Aeromicrobium marinum DSM 15272]